MEPDYLLYSKVSLHWTPVHKGAETLPVSMHRQGGQGGVWGDDDYIEPTSLAVDQ